MKSIISLIILLFLIEKIKNIDNAAPTIPKWEFSVNIKLLPVSDISKKKEHDDDALVECFDTNDVNLINDKIVNKSIKILTITGIILKTSSLNRNEKIIK